MCKAIPMFVITINYCNYVGEMVNYIQHSKTNLINLCQGSISFYFTPYMHIFDEFYDYLEQSILTGDLCDIEEIFTEVRDK